MENYWATIMSNKAIRCFAILYLFFINSDTNAQNKEQLFGLRVSGGLANFLREDAPNRYKPRGVSYDMALFTHLNWHDTSLGFNVEMGYAQKNVKDDILGYSLHYLSFSVLPSFYFYNTRTTVFLGGSGSNLISYKVINDYPKSGQRFDTYDISAIIGFSQQIFASSSLRIDVDTRFNMGFLNIRSTTWLDKIRNYGFNIGFLLKKDLRKKK